MGRGQCAHDGRFAHSTAWQREARAHPGLSGSRTGDEAAEAASCGCRPSVTGLQAPPGLGHRRTHRRRALRRQQLQRYRRLFDDYIGDAIDVECTLDCQAFFQVSECFPEVVWAIRDCVNRAGRPELMPLAEEDTQMGARGAYVLSQCGPISESCYPTECDPTATVLTELSNATNDDGLHDDATDSNNKTGKNHISNVKLAIDTVRANLNNPAVFLLHPMSKEQMTDYAFTGEVFDLMQTEEEVMEVCAYAEQRINEMLHRLTARPG